MISVRRPEPAKSAAPCAKPVSHGALQPLRAATAGGGGRVLRGMLSAADGRSCGPKNRPDDEKSLVFR
ncbi:MAG TPA: hypothetical protein DCW71_08110 [Alistipes sp.]|nr:hypothetical protein [Alistipes sp.]